MKRRRKVQWERMLKAELDEAISECPVVYLSFGLCEPHGLYNPLGLDALKAHGLCVMAARKGGGVVGPGGFWHVHEDNVVSKNWLERTTTARPTYLTSVDHEVFFKWYLLQLRACVNAGFKVIVAATGHYGGVQYWMKWYAKLFQKHFAALPIWALADWEAIDYRDEHEDYKGSHAGVCETAQLLGLHPDLPDFDHPSLQEHDPFAGGPLAPVKDRVTKQLGTRIVESQVRHLIAGVKEMLAAAPKKPFPFIPIEEINAKWESVRSQAPKFLSEMGEEEVREFYDQRVNPYQDRARRSNGKLPRHVLPDLAPETVDSEDW